MPSVRRRTREPAHDGQFTQACTGPTDTAVVARGGQAFDLEEARVVTGSAWSAEQRERVAGLGNPIDIDSAAIWHGSHAALADAISLRLTVCATSARIRWNRNVRDAALGDREQCDQQSERLAAFVERYETSDLSQLLIEPATT